MLPLSPSVTPGQQLEPSQTLFPVVRARDRFLGFLEVSPQVLRRKAVERNAHA